MTSSAGHDLLAAGAAVDDSWRVGLRGWLVNPLVHLQYRRQENALRRPYMEAALPQKCPFDGYHSGEASESDLGIREFQVAKPDVAGEWGERDY